MKDLDEKLDQLERDGFVLIKGALSPEETEQVRSRISTRRSRDGRKD